MVIKEIGYDNTWYNPGGSRVKRLLWYFCNVWFIKCHWMPLSKPRVWLLRLFGARIGTKVFIKPGVNIKYPWNLEVGDYSWIGENVWIDNLAKVSIGRQAVVSQGALLLCGNHNFKKPSFDLMVKEINIGDHAWIGANCTVCQGVIASEYSVLCVGSVASSNLEAYGIYRGNPAVKVKERIVK